MEKELVSLEKVRKIRSFVERILNYVNEEEYRNYYTKLSNSIGVESEIGFLDYDTRLSIGEYIFNKVCRKINPQKLVDFVLARAGFEYVKSNRIEKRYRYEGGNSYKKEWGCGVWKFWDDGMYSFSVLYDLQEWRYKVILFILNKDNLEEEDEEWGEV